MLVLEEIYRTKKNEFSAAFNLRMQRSLSWWKKAIEFHNDIDMQFMTAWVALSALYAQGQTADNRPCSNLCSVCIKKMSISAWRESFGTNIHKV